MYQPLLTNRYLTSRVIPLIAVAAVALCVALVIIVVSVMTGFLNMVRESGRKLMGDVVIARPVTGIAYYDDLIDALQQQPEIAAATPIIDSWGLLKMPYPHGDAKQTETVQVWGIEPDGFARVTGFGDTMHWSEVPENQRPRMVRDAIVDQSARLREETTLEQQIELTRWWFIRTSPPGAQITDEQALRQSVQTMPPDRWHFMIQDLASIDRGEILREVLGDAVVDELASADPRVTDPGVILNEGLTLRRRGRSAIVPGLHVSEGNQRRDDGTYEILDNGYWWLPSFDITLTMMPVEAGGALDPVSRIFPVANEFKSDVFLIDDTRVFIPLADAQEMLHMNEAERVDPQTFEPIGVDPARVTMILVRGSANITPDDLKDYVALVYHGFRNRLLEREGVEPARIPPPEGVGLSILTWEQQQARFIGPVEKERELMRTLFTLVYLVCAGLVLAIFWAIVYEKTRDIGILRSIGASRIGISWIFLRYGFVIGVLGAIVGLGLAVLVVRNINSIHTALGDPPLWLAFVTGTLAAVALTATILRSASGRLTPLVLGSLVTLVLSGATAGILVLRHFGGFSVWSPEVYYFTTIPNRVDWFSAGMTMIFAVIFSLIGAFLPAAKAADTDPVQALRYE